MFISTTIIYWFISNHNMGCVSILTFQNVIHPQKRQFLLRKSHQAEAVAAPGSPVLLGEGGGYIAGKGILPMDEHLCWGVYINWRNLLKTFLNNKKNREEGFQQEDFGIFV